MFFRPILLLKLVNASNLLVKDVLDKLIIPLSTTSHNTSSKDRQEVFDNLSSGDVHSEEYGVGQSVDLWVQRTKALA